MKYTLYNNGEIKKQFNDYCTACLFALLKGYTGEMFIRDDEGHKMMVVRTVGARVMYKHFECEVVQIHNHTLKLRHENEAGIPVAVMGVKPWEVRPIGSKASETYYRTMMARKLMADCPTLNYCESIRDMLAMQIIGDAEKPIEREFNRRINGFLSAVETYMSNKKVAMAM